MSPSLHNFAPHREGSSNCRPCYNQSARTIAYWHQPWIALLATSGKARSASAYQHRVPARSKQIKGRRPKPTPLLILRERTKTDDYELLARSLEGSERQGARALVDL